MRIGQRVCAFGTLLGVILAGCATPQPGTIGQPTVIQKSTAPKRITAAIMGDASTTVVQKLNPAGYIPGIDAIEELLNAGLTNLDGEGVRKAQLADQAPTIENGLWKLLPDGRMETTWHIRAGAQWHDGAPLTTEDLLFAVTVEQDQEVGIFRDALFGTIAGIEALDARTIVVRWRSPSLRADTMFSRGIALPLPKHILEKPYLENRPAFLEQSYCSDGFVGLGPYKIGEFVRGSHLILQANDQY